MSRLGSDMLVPSPGQGAVIPSRRALLSIIGAFAVLVVGLTVASPGRADRQLIERGMQLVTLGVCLECRAARAVTGKPDIAPPVGAAALRALAVTTTAEYPIRCSLEG